MYSPKSIALRVRASNGRRWCNAHEAGSVHYPLYRKAIIMRLVLITGQKGGVGKTTFANLLANWLNRQHIVWHGVDADAENKFFADVNPGMVEKLFLYDYSGRLVESAINTLVDSIAGAMEDGTTRRSWSTSVPGSCMRSSALCEPRVS
jgi:hypothetical protein